MTPGPGWITLFRSAFSESRNPMALVDDDRRFIDVNRAFLQLTGYRRADLIGERVYSMIRAGRCSPRPSGRPSSPRRSSRETSA